MRPMRLKTLDELEGVVSQKPSYDSYLVQTCYRLRSKPIGEFSIEDLRIMIGQKIGLAYLVPLALERLEENPWASGDFYPGDLLTMMLRAAYACHARADLRDRWRTLLQRALQEIPTLQHVDNDGLPNLDVPDEQSAGEFAVALRQALDELEHS